MTQEGLQKVGFQEKYRILPEELYYEYIGFEIFKFIENYYIFILDKMPYSIFSIYKFLFVFSYFLYSFYVDDDYIMQLDSYLMVLSKGGFSKEKLDKMTLTEKRKYLDYLVDIFRSMNDPNYKKGKQTSPIKTIDNKVLD